MVSYKKISNVNNIYQFTHTPCHVVDKNFKLQSGELLFNPRVAYKTYGKLNKKKSNAILICHALTGDQYAAGINPVTRKKGWWHDMVGKDKVFNTKLYYIICCNVLGGCMGTTGPKSINSKTKNVYVLKYIKV